MKPTLHYDNGQPDHDRYEREEHAYDRHQDDKADRRRNGDQLQSPQDIIHTDRQQVIDNLDYHD